MPNPTPDYVQVRLTAAGQALAGAGGLRISNGRRTFVFEGETAQKVELSYEWRGVLGRKFTAAGEPMFEVVPDAPATTAAAGTAPASAATPAPASPSPAAAAAAVTATAAAPATEAAVTAPTAAIPPAAPKS